MILSNCLGLHIYVTFLTTIHHIYDRHQYGFMIFMIRIMSHWQERLETQLEQVRAQLLEEHDQLQQAAQRDQVGVDRNMYCRSSKVMLVM